MMTEIPLKKKKMRQSLFVLLILIAGCRSSVETGSSYKEPPLPVPEPVRPDKGCESYVKLVSLDWPEGRALVETKSLTELRFSSSYFHALSLGEVPEERRPKLKLKAYSCQVQTLRISHLSQALFQPIVEKQLIHQPEEEELTFPLPALTELAHGNHEMILRVEWGVDGKMKHDYSIRIIKNKFEERLKHSLTYYKTPADLIRRKRTTMFWDGDEKVIVDRLFIRFNELANKGGGKVLIRDGKNLGMKLTCRIEAEGEYYYTRPYRELVPQSKAEETHFDLNLGVNELGPLVLVSSPDQKFLARCRFGGDQVMLLQFQLEIVE